MEVGRTPASVETLLWKEVYAICFQILKLFRSQDLSDNPEAASGCERSREDAFVPPAQLR
jgi:hypothetical protein